jgi:hypothetical protein
MLSSSEKEIYKLFINDLIFSDFLYKLEGADVEGIEK